MDEKDQKSLTVSDILDQLIKPSFSQGRIVEPPKRADILSPRPATLPLSEEQGVGVGLPPLSQVSQEVDKMPVPQRISEKQGSVVLPPSAPRLSEVRLSIRTMAGDLARLKKGQSSPTFEVQRTIMSRPEVKKEVPKKKELLPGVLDLDLETQEIIPPSLTRPIIPPILRETSGLPSLRSPSLKKEQQAVPLSGPKPFIKEEIHVVEKDEDLLPPFPGAPVPKKTVPKPKEEKVEYGIIAKVIGSGMTAGIITTIILATIVYWLIYFFFIKEEEIVITTPLPVPTKTVPAAQVNELENIFKAISSTTFVASPDDQQTVSGFLSFVEKEKISKKDFKKVNFQVLPNRQKPTFPDLLERLSVNYPDRLKNLVRDSNIVLLYGQDEIFIENVTGLPLRLVFITEVKTIDETMAVMKDWEVTMPDDLKDVFGLNISKQSSAIFLDNERHGVKIRYKNFPFPDKSIDYSIITSLTGRHYLVITNSRESMYSPADKIQGL